MRGVKGERRGDERVVCARQFQLKGQWGGQNLAEKGKNLTSFKMSKSCLLGLCTSESNLSLPASLCSTVYDNKWGDEEG